MSWLAYLEAGCKPKEDWRIGTEHEKFAFLTDTLEPVPYFGERSIKALLDGMAERFGWQPAMEGEHIIGLTDPVTGGNVSLEPGGQFELSGAPLENIFQTCQEVHEHLMQVREVGDELGIGFLGLGFNPKWGLDDTPVMPKGRYKIMMRIHGQGRAPWPSDDVPHLHGADQSRLRIRSRHGEEVPGGLALQPLATALFANSPFMEGKPNGFLSFRSQIWKDTDPDRTGMLPFVFEDGMGFERYVDYALDVPMYFVRRGGKYLDASGLSFRDFMAGKLEILPGELPAMEDFADHLSTIFPEVRLKRFLEMRGSDAGPWSHLCAFSAFWVGLLYCPVCLDGAWDRVKNWTAAEREAMRQSVRTSV
jgi:glutamate--cysteine ligase